MLQVAPVSPTFGRFPLNQQETRLLSAPYLTDAHKNFGTICSRRRFPSVSDCAENDDGPKTKLGRKRNLPKNENTENETGPKLANLQFRRRKRKRNSVGLQFALIGQTQPLHSPSPSSLPLFFRLKLIPPSGWVSHRSFFSTCFVVSCLPISFLPSLSAWSGELRCNKFLSCRIHPLFPSYDLFISI